jgi:hypothetical protein
MTTQARPVSRTTEAGSAPGAALEEPGSTPAQAGVSELYMVGGQQRGLRPLASHFTNDWYAYDKGIILQADVATGQTRTIVEWITPPEARPDKDPAILFKSGTLDGDRLYVTTQTEVLVYRVPSFEMETYLSLPCFNDVHHARPTPNGNILVAITGLDMVAEVTPSGELVHAWNVLALGESVWGTRFSKNIDYRKIATTKPHLAHPNHVFYIGEEPWATRFEQRDAISLLDPSRRIDIGVQRLHDGIVYDDRVYFTAVNGKVVIADTGTLKVLEIIDLMSMHKPDTLLGWCRGLMLDGNRMWIGFSRMRPTKFGENVAWVKNGFRHHPDTHVGLYDLGKRQLVTELDVDAAGLNAVFGIYPAVAAFQAPGAPTQD